jgi:hypothetical protein
LFQANLDRDWVAGKTYALKLFMFVFLPAGEHRITLVVKDRSDMGLRSSARTPRLVNHDGIPFSEIKTYETVFS